MVNQYRASSVLQLGGFCALMADTGAFTNLVIWGWMSFIFSAIIMIVGACES